MRTEGICEDCRHFFLEDGNRCCRLERFFVEIDNGLFEKSKFIEDGLTSCGGFDLGGLDRLLRKIESLVWIAKLIRYKQKLVKEKNIYENCR